MTTPVFSAHYVSPAVSAVDVELPAVLCDSIVTDNATTEVFEFEDF